MSKAVSTLSGGLSANSRSEYIITLMRVAMLSVERVKAVRWVNVGMVNAERSAAERGGAEPGYGNILISIPALVIISSLGLPIPSNVCIDTSCAFCKGTAN